MAAVGKKPSFLGNFSSSFLRSETSQSSVDRDSASMLVRCVTISTGREKAGV